MVKLNLTDGNQTVEMEGKAVVAFGEPWPDGLDNLANVFAWMPIPKPYNPDMPSDKGDEEHN